MTAHGQQRIDLWPQGAPHPSSNPQDTAWVEVFLVEHQDLGGRCDGAPCIVILPGGGYSHLAIDHEGRQWAPFFNGLGFSVVVLKYRMPHGDKRIPIEDAEEAIRMVRRNAARWNINPQDIGIMGSSAGGHLASTIATHAEKEAKPNFQILFYPVITMEEDLTHKGSHDNFMGNKPKKREVELYSNDAQVTRVTPRAWIALSDDDHVVLPANGVNYYNELYRHDVPASLHVYPSGGHGWGIRPTFKYHIEMLLELKAWLKSF
jgi:acetyl esterase/lipase